MGISRQDPGDSQRVSAKNVAKVVIGLSDEGFEAKYAVVDSVHRELERLAKRDAQLAESPLAMAALALARELDSYGNSATSKANCVKELRDTLAALWALAPVEEETSKVDELQKRRVAKLRSAEA